MAQAGTPSSRSGKPSGRAFVLLVFGAGACLLLLGSNALSDGAFGILGTFAVFVGAGMAIAFGERDMRWTYVQLATGAALVLAVAAVGIEAIESQHSYFKLGTGVSCLTQLGIASVVLLASGLSERKQRPVMELFMYGVLVLGLLSVLPHFIHYIPRVLAGNYEIPTESGTVTSDMLPWVEARVAAFIALFILATLALAARHFLPWRRKRRLQEAEFFTEGPPGPDGGPRR